MKTHWSAIACALSVATFFSWSNIAPAQTVIAETTTGSGIITDYVPGGEAIIVREESSSAPVRYALTERTTFIDETGAPVLAEKVTSGMPITVHYVRDGSRMLASRVVVRQSVSTPVAVSTPVVTERKVVAASTTAGGVITNFTPGARLIVRSESAEPLTYAVTGSTTYVDDAGTPIAVGQIAPGAPVTVQYVREGDELVASRVIVARPAAAVSPAPVIRQTTTTTTTKSDDDDDDD
ncbi:hypothetical protein DES53_107111 [Roseimicrobium gellanilyticum]|uniref:DUF5666 domain-containing protein n=1 Tax=Roseimicrobium gellanilyticum TaxID=748857 RepID=A0A366HGT4_9BACT|nr:hypothetical protein [Roseimicrobium gellanilyticum]RBP41280.1 hypothetical protein DES53_107111 [Roseimicrobium gellanilyticum]